MAATLRHSWHHAPLAVRCGTCRQPVGRPCTANGNPLAQYHVLRKRDLPALTPDQKDRLIGMVLDLRALWSDATQAAALVAEIKLFLNSL